MRAVLVLAVGRHPDRRRGLPTAKALVSVDKLLQRRGLHVEHGQIQLVCERVLPETPQGRVKRAVLFAKLLQRRHCPSIGRLFNNDLRPFVMQLNDLDL